MIVATILSQGPFMFNLEDNVDDAAPKEYPPLLRLHLLDLTRWSSRPNRGVAVITSCENDSGL